MTDPVFIFLKVKAQDLGDRLLPAFDTKFGLPLAFVNLRTGKAKAQGWVPCSCVILSEVGTLTLEFEELSKVTGDPKYKDAVTRAMSHVLALDRSKTSGLFPNFIALQSSGFSAPYNVRLGAMGDSFYEYLFKTWWYHGGVHSKSPAVRDERALFDTLMRHVNSTLLKLSPKDGLLYVGDKQHGVVQKRMDHLACFLGGQLQMAVVGAPPDLAEWYASTGAGLTATCHAAYARTKTGLGPDIMGFSGTRPDGAASGQSWYWLRPETVESYFYLWRQTGDQRYRDWAWDAALAIEKHCRCGAGYCGLKDVDVPGSFNPIQESFFLAETLKYLYLTFAGDDVLPLDKWVFNTEAHPLPVAGVA